ncbi:UTP--GlnB (protein PII) uridylyltransferase, GlnD [Chitinasiproducens palmae]|uniref:Bifunctional uridylyltransferase/uridylyl-removing enzyme n=1 Tax=Chitinasiproducens palmae TaxID=1770053 RepID=A0A1H2PLR9_9BURK|nr:UTP--GlnB (protein PII) uridylyltransferase, GlnD [Chitinasiproducens palmae]
MPAPAEGSVDDLGAWRARIKQSKQQLFDRFDAGGRADSLARSLAMLADQVLSAAWLQCGLPDDAALVAVGGYGRGELAPYSDVDILVLLCTPADEATAARIERFIGAAWDLGMDIGSSVRTLDECLAEAQADVTIQTSMLEARRIVGSPDCYARFRAGFDAALDPRTFFDAKLLEMRQRHAKYQDTPYSLEPNCKESPGGLRDLQLILWIARAAGYGSSWAQLESGGLLTAHEAREVRRNENFLKTLRARLHLLARRRQDIIVFDLQTALAESFGYRTTHQRRASEPLMRRYYWAAKAVTQLSTVLLQNIEARLNPDTSGVTRVLSPRFVEKQRMIEVVDDEVFEREPTAILEAFVLYERTHGVNGLSARTLRALYNARHVMNLAWRRDPRNRRLFLDILQAPHGVTHALRLMNQTSVLGSYLLNFGRIVGQMQHDLYHVYTVDQHILMVLRNVRRFAVPDHAHEYPLCSELIADFERPWVLYVAALFHDIAKGRGGDHSQLGMGDARRFCREHGIGEADSALIVWLVEHHLTMSQFAQKQDTSDPAVLRRFADIVGDERHLIALYLLTVADIRGTSPKVWNTWKGRLLEDLFRRARQVLDGAPTDPRTELRERRDGARALLRLQALPEGVEKRLWDDLDVSYFLRHSSEDIAWHTRALHDVPEGAGPRVKARPAPQGEGLQVLIYAKDQPDLFAAICAYFERASLSVLEAHVHTTRRDYALDHFLVVDRDLDAGYRDIANLVEKQLCERLLAHAAGEAPLPTPSRGRLSRLSRAFPIAPRVDLRSDEAGQYYLLSVSANDRTGLLYEIARVFARHHLVLHAARINTLGERVEDTFMIAGRSLGDARMQLQLETELLRAVSI